LFRRNRVCQRRLGPNGDCVAPQKACSPCFHEHRRSEHPKLAAPVPAGNPSNYGVTYFLAQGRPAGLLMRPTRRKVEPTRSGRSTPVQASASKGRARGCGTGGREFQISLPRPALLIADLADHRVLAENQSAGRSHCQSMSSWRRLGASRQTKVLAQATRNFDALPRCSMLGSIVVAWCPKAAPGASALQTH
jgi:hypothetical protein